MPPTLVHRLEYAALRAFNGLLSLLDIRSASRAAGSFAELGYAPLGIRRGVTERQIAAAFPEWSAEKVEATARESYRNLGRVAIEATRVSRGGPQDVLALFGPSPGWAIVEAAMAKGKGVIFVAGHLGNWELSGAYVAARGVPVHPIARGMSNPLSDAYFRRTRERLGMHIMHDQEAVRRVPRVLRDGQTVGFLSDQATVGLASTFVPFFGRPAKTPRGAAVFALRGDYPVLLIQAVRQPDGLYEFVAEEIPVVHTGDREHDVDEVMHRFSEALERWVRRYPGQYFWQHRRWKHQPDDTPPELREP
ncbi:MAG TPA: lysophospholipid acyltransferase family protein [Gemmatimonadaceae bacterium]|nr:lysophospholipid acyltransferase family protein [Gemmatimonadaceae bacterium]